MNTQTFNPDRLTLLRERAGMTKEELAQRCGVSRRAVTGWESGQVTTPPLAVLASVFDVEETFFSEPSGPVLDAVEVSFRALSSLGARKAKRVLAAARLSLEFSEWLDENYITPAIDLPSLDELASPLRANDVNPSEAARLLRAAWRLGDRPIKDMMELLEKHGCRIFGVAPEDRDVDAFSFWLEGRAFVFINPEKSAERLRFDLAHELGHLMLHKGVSTARERHYEFQANEFASAFLMPGDGLLAQVATTSRQLKMADVMTLKKSWRVSAVAMVRRLYDLNVIGEWHYRNWMVDLSSRGYRRQEPDGIHREQSRLISMVLSSARDSGMTVADIARSSRVPLSAVEQSLLGLAFVPLGRRPGTRSVEERQAR